MSDAIKISLLREDGATHLRGQSATADTFRMADNYLTVWRSGVGRLFDHCSFTIEGLPGGNYEGQFNLMRDEAFDLKGHLLNELTTRLRQVSHASFATRHLSEAARVGKMAQLETLITFIKNHE